MSDIFIDPAEGISQAQQLISRGAELMTVATDRIEEIATTKTKLPFYFPGMLDTVVPLEPGTTTVVSGRSSEGKTLALNHWALQAAHALRGNPTDIIVYVDLETFKDQASLKYMRNFDPTVPTEGQMIAMASQGQPYKPDARVVENVFKRALPNLVVISPTMENAHMLETMTINRISEWLHQIQDGTVYGHKLNIVACFIDYLGVIPKDIQALKADGVQVSNKTEVIEWTANKIFIMAGALKCAMVIGTQAPKVVDQNGNVQIPSLFQSANSSDLGRRAHAYVSVSMPKMYLKEESAAKFTVDGTQFQTPVVKNLQLIQLTKHRITGAHDDVGKIWCYHWTDDGPKLIQPNPVDPSVDYVRSNNGGQF